MLKNLHRSQEREVLHIRQFFRNGGQSECSDDVRDWKNNNKDQTYSCLRGWREPLRTSQHYRIEGFKRALSRVPHYAEIRQSQTTNINLSS